MWRREVRATPEQRAALTWMLHHDPKPYRRERAAAILQVADGKAAFAVARAGLLVRRAPDTVYGWIDRFEELGIAGLTMAAGRGRQPTHFPPSGQRSSGGAGRAGADPGERPSGVAPAPAAESVDAVRAGRRAPRVLAVQPLGVWRILAQHKLHRRRGRDHLRSPDPAYHEKLAEVARRLAAVRADPTEAVLLYQDEVTSYRQPSLGYAYAPTCSTDPRAERSLQGNTATRVTAALEPQTSPFPFFTPPSWPTAPSPNAKRLNLPIQLVPLPAYAPWTNPIEARPSFHRDAA